MGGMDIDRWLIFNQCIGLMYLSANLIENKRYLSIEQEQKHTFGEGQEQYSLGKEYSFLCSCKLCFLVFIYLATDGAVRSMHSSIIL